MIYTNDYTKEEMDKSLLSSGGKKWRMLIYSFLITLVVFVITMVLFSLDSTIIYEWIPSLSGANAKSMFAVMTILVPIIVIFEISYAFSHYLTTTFAEVHTNRMYLLIKMGVKTSRVIWTRIYSAVMMPILVYCTSFILSLFISLIFNYSLNIVAMPGLFLSGLIIITLTSVSILALSLFIKNRKYAVTLYLFLFIGAFVLSYVSNYSNVIMASINVANLDVLFGPKTSYFLFICLGLIVALLILIVVRSLVLVRYYTTTKTEIPNIVVIDYAKNVPTKVKKDNSKKKEKAFNATIYTIFGIFAGLAFATNCFLIYMATNNLTTQSLYNDYIPVMFASETMKQGDNVIDETLSEPQYIEKNDLVFFESVTNKDYDLKVNNVIYYINQDTSEAMVEKILSIDGDNYKIDITYYPNNDDAGKFATTITRSQIKGVLTYVNRGLGAWITVNDSTVGKVVFLVLPLAIIIFYDQIKKVIIAYNKVDDEETYEKEIKGDKKKKTK